MTPAQVGEELQRHGLGLHIPRITILSTEDENMYEIPSYFFREDDDDAPIAQTVGGLIALLQDLPADLPVQSSFGREVKVTIYNIGEEDCHACVEEA